MKKLIVFIIMLVMSLSFCSAAFADGTDEHKDEEEPTRSSYVSTTVTDNGNNRYTVAGSVSYSGKTGSVWTYFKNTYVYDGSYATQLAIKNATKTLGAHGDLWYSGGGYLINGFGSITHTVSHSLEETYNPTYSATNNINYATGSHVFSYNGAYWTASTSYPY